MSFPTILRTIGTTNSIVGKAIVNALTYAFNQILMKSAGNPKLIAVITPDMMQDMKREVKKAKTIVSKRFGIIV